ncbi:MAG: hypothetical protein ABL994_01225 [Verrucomicrobiales bacterium]
MDNGRFRRGITLDEDGGGDLWDPWGNHYRVRFDADGNDRVANPDPAISSLFPLEGHSWQLSSRRLRPKNSRFSLHPEGPRDDASCRCY